MYDPFYTPLEEILGKIFIGAFLIFLIIISILGIKYPKDIFMFRLKSKFKFGAEPNENAINSTKLFFKIFLVICLIFFYY